MDLTVSICNRESKIAICLFNGTQYTVFPAFHDDFSLSTSLRIIGSCKPASVVASISEIFQEALKAGYGGKLSYMQTKRRGTVLKSVGDLENTAVCLLASFLGHAALMNVESAALVGYAGEVPIRKDASGAVESFFMDEYVLSNIEQFERLDSLVKNSITSFGKHTIRRWISSPLKDREAILGRRAIVEYVACKVPKLRKLLKRCRMNCFDQTVSLFKLRMLVKSALSIQKQLRGKMTLENGRRYLKLYKILRIFSKEGIQPGNDRKLDELREVMGQIPAVLERFTKKVSQKYQVPISCVYLPGAGFFIESSDQVEEPLFKIKDKFYSKCDEMKDLDEKLGDPYERCNAREGAIAAKLIQKIHNVCLSPLYDFIGTVDSYVSLYMNTGGEFPEVIECGEGPSTCVCSGTRLDNCTVFLGEFSMKQVAESVVVSQIGGRCGAHTTKLPIFERLIYKAREHRTGDTASSTFQNEIIQLSKAYRHSNPNSLCLFEGVVEATSPADGMRLFSRFMELISAKVLVISTNFEHVDLRKCPAFQHASFYVMRDDVQRPVYEDCEIKYEISEIFGEYCEAL